MRIQCGLFAFVLSVHIPSLLGVESTIWRCALTITSEYATGLQLLLGAHSKRNYLAASHCEHQVGVLHWPIR